MRFSLSAAAVVGIASLLVSAVPTVNQRGTDGNVFPLEDGFPKPSADQLNQIQKNAFGTLSNAPPPPSLSPDGITNLQLVAFNELHEVAFFNQLIHNITTGVPGYDVKDKDFVLKTLKAILAQEELHAINANRALQRFGATPLEPCKYAYPVTTFDQAIGLAATFTSVVLGTLQDVVQVFAEGGNAGVARGVAATIGQEGEQEGWFRLLQGKIPNELPFLSTSVRDLAFTAVQGFTVPGSCTGLDKIQLKTFQPLGLVKPPGAQSGPIQFTFKQDCKLNSDLSVVYINQQNLPIVEKLKVIGVKDEVVTVEANFPYTENLMNGLTLAVLTTSAGPFANARAAVAATVFGPAIIIIN